MERRKNIALFVAMIENDFSYAICEGALLGAAEIDANLFILPAGIIDAKYDDVDANVYRYQYNTLYSFVNSKSFDAIILEYGTITSFLDAQEKKKFLEQIVDVPVILLAGQEEGYSSICVDNKAGLQEAILHLIHQHNCTKIGFVSGPSTSQDALERLEVYRDTMTEEGLFLGEDWIVYGNFSEFSEEVVGELLDRHPDIEAIVFANDQMASGGYNVFKQRNLEPGKDILVTGFDNSSVAMLLEPHLASVKADTKELAYLAVLESLNVMKGETVNKYVKSRLITRESCGCNVGEAIIKTDDYIGGGIDSAYAKQLADQMFNQYFSNYFESEKTLQIKRMVEEYFEYFFSLVKKDGTVELNLQEFCRRFRVYCQTYTNGYIDLNTFQTVNYMLYDYVSQFIKDERGRVYLMSAVSTGNRQFMTALTQEMMTFNEKAKEFEIVLTTITRDMLQFAEYEDKKYNSVISKFRRMNFSAGYIFTYLEGIPHGNGDEWIQPDTLYVKAYHNRDDVHLFNGNERDIEADSIFASDIMPKDRRCDMLVLPLFSRGDVYGIIMTESEMDYFRYATQIACQVSASVEILEILDKQNAIKQELEKNLAKMEESNRVLDAMSHSDPLTGIANRRGFLDTVNKILEDENNLGKEAIAVYADMDNLKIVNDEFGHDEGDFSLKTIANALSESFRSSDVVARMGGDEFAAFAIVSHENFAETLKSRIHAILAEMNENDKPYYVNMSIGTHEFVIEKDLNLDHILNEADRDLYREKKNKKKVIYKEKKE